MHKLRQKAKQHAWYDREDEPATYNPFRKIRTGSRTSNRPRNVDRDVEEGRGTQHKRTFSEPTARPESGTLRERNLQAPKHANTVPGSASSSHDGFQHDQPGEDLGLKKMESPIAQSEHEDDTVRDKEIGSPILNGKDSTSSNTIVPSSADEKPRLRGKFKNMFHKGEETVPEEDEDKPQRPKYTVMSQLRATIFNSWINVLFLAVPVGIALHPAGVDPIVVFVVNFIAIIPLAAMLSYATEEISLRTGETIGGLLNATFGNAVELIVSIIALLKNEITIVKTSLIGSMLSNLLLVMGMCFFFGGINRVEQNFNVVVAQTAASLLALAIGSLIIPTAFLQQSSSDGTNGSSVAERMGNLAPLSRGTAIILLVVYGCYLYFQLKTHLEMYNAPSEKSEKRSSGKKEKGEAMRGLINAGGIAATSQGQSVEPRREEEEEDEAEVPQLSLWVALATLAISTVLVAICAEFMVDGIGAVSNKISRTFVGLILLPIVGNAAEHATAVTVAVKDKMDLAIGVAVGSSMQIALLVLPLIVILGWITGHNDMTLFFDTFQIAVLFIAILLVNYLIQDGKSHWLEGVLLQILYVLIALACYFYGDEGESNKV